MSEGQLTFPADDFLVAEEENINFRIWAQANYKPGDFIDPQWKPEIQKACATVNSRVTTHATNIK